VPPQANVAMGVTMAKTTDLFERREDEQVDPHAVHVDELDPAQQSLADAMRVSFLILKLIMAGLVIYYVFISGWYEVKENEQAVRLRFGRIVQSDIGVGWHFAWPYPIEEAVKVSSSTIPIILRAPFWYEQTDFRVSNATGGDVQGRPGPLNPGKDGYLVTGDVSVVHAQVSVTYQIKDSAAFNRGIGESDNATRFVEIAAEQAMVRAAASVTSDDLIRRGRGFSELVQQYTQANLDRFEVGISITNVSLVERAIPASVYPAHIDVTEAAGERATLILAAEKGRERIRVDAAGSAYDLLWAMITAYERAVDLDDLEESQRLADELDQAFATLQVGPAEAPTPIIGAAAEIISKANAYRAEVVAKIKAEAGAFSALLPEYRLNPQIVISRRWQDARKIIFGDPDLTDSLGYVEKIYVPAGSTVNLRMGPDAQLAQKHEIAIAKAKAERDAKIRAQEQRRQGGR
jgi:membrane protease subunit HflK